jgi:hypothetical protein
VAKPEFKTFFFHGEAHALSGQFHRPVVTTIEAQAATTLATIGGVGHSRAGSFQLPRLVSFRAAYSHVSGSRQDETTFTTSVMTVIEGVSILDVLTADRITLRLTSEHKIDSKEGHILALGSGFSDLRFGSHNIKITLRHNLLIECPTFADLSKRLAKDKKPEKISEVSGGAALCSLVEEIETDIPGATREGHLLRIPHFGEIAFAEIFADPGTRSLTMMRRNLGSPDGGSMVVSQGRINGQTWP